MPSDTCPENAKHMPRLTSEKNDTRAPRYISCQSRKVSSASSAGASELLEKSVVTNSLVWLLLSVTAPN